MKRLHFTLKILESKEILLLAIPVKTLPAIIIGTFQAVAIRVHPITLGITANLIVFSLPMLSIKTPAVNPPIGVTKATALAKVGANQLINEKKNVVDETTDQSRMIQF